MRIVKYFLLLILLFLIGLSVFVSTQKGDYDVTRSIVIKNQRAVVYNFINDYKNWGDFCVWIKKGNSSKFNYPERTVGQGASCFWENNENTGKIVTILTKENESISQKMFNNDQSTEIYWKLKDTSGGTKVTWRVKGKLDFNSKIAAFFNGGINSVVGEIYKKSLEKLNKSIDYEINTFTIKVDGIVSLPGCFYLKQFSQCKKKNIDKNLKVLVSKMQLFFKKNKITSSGKTFIIYNKYEKSNNDVEFSVCMPVKDSINIIPGSDVELGKIESYTNLKTTLTGDYSHTQKAWKKAMDYISKNHLERNNSGKIVEVYKIGRKDINNPSKWVTEIYIPIYPKSKENSVKKTSNDSLKVKKPETETEKNSQ